MRTRNILITSSAAVIAAIAIGAGGASAAGVNLFGSEQIRDDSVRSIDVKDGTLQAEDLRPGTLKSLKGEPGTPGTPGTPGKTGPAGTAGTAGAYWATAFYDVGDTNAGAIATVACKHTTDSAIAGGVQVLGLDAGANSRNTPVSSSFPGRMDWETNAPKVNRIDGWIVQFGGNAGATADVAPEKVKVWALCLPTEVKTVQTYQQSS